MPEQDCSNGADGEHLELVEAAVAYRDNHTEETLEAVWRVVAAQAESAEDLDDASPERTALRRAFADAAIALADAARDKARADALRTEAAAWRPLPSPAPVAPVKRLPTTRPEPVIRYFEHPAQGELLSAGSVSVLAGAGGVGKSRIALQLAMTAAGTESGFGNTGFGLEVLGGPVLVVGYEDDPGFVRFRCEAMARVSDTLRAGFNSDRMHYQAAAGHPIFGPRGDDHRPGLYNARPEELAGWRPLWKAAAGIGARLVIIDPATCAYVGEPNALTAVREFITALSAEATKLGAGVLLVCHSTKAARQSAAERDDPGHVAGSAAWVDGARGALTMTPRYTTTGKGTEREQYLDGYDLTVTKANYGEAGVSLELNEHRDDKRRPVAYRQAAAAKLEAVSTVDADQDIDLV